MGAAGIEAGAPIDALPVEAKTDRRRRTSVCPDGQVTLSSASAMGRRCSKVSSQVLHRYS
jgi:hypothetical protein